MTSQEAVSMNMDRTTEQEHAKWMHATLNSVFAYQWKCLAFGGKSVVRTWRFWPKPPNAKPLGWRTAGKYLRFWLSRGTWGLPPSQTNRATLMRRYGPLVMSEKPRYWSDCHGSEPTLFRHDPEWTLESSLEHRRRTMGDWTAQDDAKARDWFARTFGNEVTR